MIQKGLGGHIQIERLGSWPWMARRQVSRPSPSAMMRWSVGGSCGAASTIR